MKRTGRPDGLIVNLAEAGKEEIAEADAGPANRATFVRQFDHPAADAIAEPGKKLLFVALMRTGSQPIPSTGRMA